MAKSAKKPMTVNGGSLAEVKATATPVVRRDSTSVGGVMRSKADVAAAVGTLNSTRNASVGPQQNLNLGGKNDTSDTVNAMIERRKRLTGGSQ